ncbi:hypothetical protein [Nocardioides jiangxiensis]|uniref:WD40 repeat domain-containing protein n=1 Tax=Nocardioides jiangxiensis TaxID=3064524 RepID=A0ABT9B2L6_9ACTN|nr:hypothetical protein [Nocardioides sp. WY-20]MDO7868453.1 hypothetical protein [Nocardioides sp. WY-20]
MTDALREELARIGDGAAPVTVAPDVWARGRRARRRDRVVLGAAALTVLVALAGLGLTVRGVAHDAAPVGTGVEAVPSVIQGVPQRLIRNYESGEVWDRRVGETDLAIGRGAMAFGSGQSVYEPVVVTAADGVYHPLELPGWYGNTTAGFSESNVPLALSPDGARLAWAWADLDAPQRSPVPSGIRIGDLRTGHVRTIRLVGRDGIVVGAIAWSPDGRWLVWQGRMQTTWTRDTTRSGPNSEVAGRIGPGGVSQAVPLTQTSSVALAIENSGRVLLVGSHGWSTWGGRGVDRGFLRTREPDTLPGDGTAGAMSPAGHLALAGGVVPTSAVTFVNTGSRAALDRNVPDPPYSEGALIQPVGWIDDDHVVVVATAAHDVSDAGWRHGETRLAVVSAPWASDDVWKPVASFDTDYEKTGEIKAPTVAVDLMSLDHPTRDFPAPTWPWSDERKAAVIGGAALAVVAVLVFVVSHRRGRRLRD